MSNEAQPPFHLLYGHFSSMFSKVRLGPLLIQFFLFSQTSEFPLLSPRVCPNLCPIESEMPSNHLILCCPLLLLPLIFPSIRDLSSELALHIRCPQCWSFSFDISPSNEYSRLISFWVDWFDLLAVQGFFKSLLQHHSLKASIPWCTAFFMVQPPYPYMTTEKNQWYKKRIQMNLSIKKKQSYRCRQQAYSYLGVKGWEEGQI